MPKTDQEEYARRLADCEQTMIRMRSSHRTEQVLAAKYKVNARAVRKWMLAVRKKWREEAAFEQDRDALRDDMHTTLNEIMFQALNRTVVVKDAAGNPVLDTDKNSPNFGKPIIKANPDLQKALHACLQLRAMHGMDKPSKAIVQLDAAVSRMPDLDVLKPDQIEKLRSLLTSVAPDNDLRKLAGEWFARAEESAT